MENPCKTTENYSLLGFDAWKIMISISSNIASRLQRSLGDPAPGWGLEGGCQCVWKPKMPQIRHVAVGQNLRYLFGDYPPKVVYFKGFWDRGTGVLTHCHECVFHVFPRFPHVDVFLPRFSQKTARDLQTEAWLFGAERLSKWLELTIIHPKHHICKRCIGRKHEQRTYHPLKVLKKAINCKKRRSRYS